MTLESFWVGFSDSFVLQGHGVFPSGSCRLNRRSSRSRSSSSSRRKKWLKSHRFLWVSGSYIRHFLRAILMPFRPSLPWCFPIRELPFEQKEQSKARAGAGAAAEGKSSQNHSFLWVSEVTLGTFWTQF